jgi:aminopeptidase-like protein
MNKNNIGKLMHSWAVDLFPINRSITGSGVRETLSYLQTLIPELNIKSVPSGTKAFDWTVPDEWHVKDAYVLDSAGVKVIDFKINNLHLVGYSASIDVFVELDELDDHLHSLPEQPTAIPYITSYYEDRWGFCLSHEQRVKLKPGTYHVVIDADKEPGVLNYAELILPGRSKEEVFLSTYICHPSMANNELSGPVVTTALAKWLVSLKNREYTYRIIFIPETIGSIVYLSMNYKYLKKYVIAGFNITCIGDDHCYSYLPSRDGETLSDRVALHVLGNIDHNFKRYTWLDRGSDERQYCSPGIDLPIATIMRSKYAEYPEYHTSLDDLNLVTDSGLNGGFVAIQDAIKVIENNFYYECEVLCEPQLGKRGLYPTLSTKNSNNFVNVLTGVISYCDGKKTVLEIAEILGISFFEVNEVIQTLVEQGLVKRAE